MIQHTITNRETNEFIERTIDSQGIQFAIDGGAMVSEPKLLNSIGFP